MRYLIVIFLMLYPFMTIGAQQRELEINYIAHDHFTEPLLRQVDEIYNVNAYNSNRKTYLYLANADSPIVMLCLPDKEKEYNDFCYAISSQIKHNIWPEEDIKHILNLLRDDDFINEDNQPRYSFVTLNFYVTSSFWQYRYYETLIGRLFWDLDLTEYENCVVNIYRPEDDAFDYNEDCPFGPKRLNGDKKIYMYTF